MIRPIILLILSIIIGHQVFPQTPEIDRLIRSVNRTSGKEKIEALGEVCKSFYSVDPKKGIEYGELALQLSRNLKMPSAKSKVYINIGLNYWAMADIKTGRKYYDSALRNAMVFNDSAQIAIYYNRMGLLYESQGLFDSCLFVFNKELSINKRLKNDERIGISMENIGTIRMKRGELKSAILYFIDAITIFEKCHNNKKLPYIYLKLGYIYSETGDFPAAEKWFQKGIDQSLAINDVQRAGIGLNALGILYKEQGMYEKALAKFREALETIKDVKSPALTLGVYDNMGNVYRLQGKMKDALNYHKKAFSLALKANMPVSRAGCEVNLGQDYFNLKDYRNAKKHYEQALPVFLSSKSISNLISTYQALIDVNNSLKDFDQAVRYYKLYNHLRDSLSQNELNSALDSLKIKFNTEQTGRENILLKQEKEIHTKTISLQRVILGSSLIVLILILILTVATIRNRRKIKKTNSLLEIKNLEISAKADELRLTNDKLVELSKFKDSMNSFLVHDLKNPLNTIINIDDKQHFKGQFEIIKQSGKQMLNLVANLLDIGKYEDKAMKISPEDISITNIISKAYNDVQYFAEQKNIHLRLEYDTDFNLKVDPGIIERVFVNLFSNAIKCSASGKSIQVYAEQISNTSLKLMVKDHGVGINPEYLPVIFNRYNQAHEKQTGIPRSSGIGLAFCKMSVEAHSGEIGIDSVVGQGTTIWFTLPLSGSRDEIIGIPLEKDESIKKPGGLHLSPEEINLLLPYCVRFKKLSINQISDVKDIINSIDYPESSNISLWKLELMSALSECNASKFSLLLNISPDAKL